MTQIPTKQQVLEEAGRASTKIRKVAEAALDAAQQLDEAKAAADHTHTAADVGAQKKPLTGTITIPTTGWTDDTTTVPGCTKRYEIPVAGATASDKAEIRFKPSAMETARVISSVNRTIDGAVQIWAVAVPSAAIPAEYWIERG